MKKLSLKLLAFISLFCLLSAIFVPTVQAKGTQVLIPVAVTAEGTLPKNGENYTVRLTADSVDNPMPDARLGGTFDLVLNGLSETVFPPIEFKTRGVFNYKINQLSGSYPDCKYDERTYTMKVTVSKGVDGGNDIVVILHEEGKDTKPMAAEFHNVYKTVSNPLIPPKTGADTSLLFWCVLMLASSFGMFGAYLFGKRRKEKYN